MAGQRAGMIAVAVLSVVVLASCGVSTSGTTGVTSTTPPPASPASSTSSSVEQPVSSSPTGAQKLITVTVAKGKVTAERTYQVPLGSTVRIEVSGDVTDEVHVHGYNVTADMSPDKPARIEFPATIPGVFEVELEKAHRTLFELEVK